MSNTKDTDQILGNEYDTLAHIDAITDATGNSVGPILNDGYTDDLQPVLSGRLPMGDGQTLRVYANGVVLGYADIKEGGYWAFQPDTPLEPGKTYDFQVFLLDSGTSVLLPSNTFTIHTTELNQDAAPDAPAITEVRDHAGDHQGPVAQGGKTDDKQPEVSGTAQAGSVVTVSVYSDVHNQTYTLGSVVADADGHWSYQLHGSQDITNGLGEWTFTATATNTVGTSEASAGYSVETVASNTDVFAAPEITYLKDNVGLHQGEITDGDKTDDKQPELHGTGEPGSVVVITMYGPVTHITHNIATLTVGKDGTWSYQFTGHQALQHGNNIFHVTTTGPDGHDLSGHNFTVDLTGSNADDNTPADTTPPDSPVITEVYDDQGVQHGPVANGGKTDDSMLNISGTAEGGSIVIISHKVEATGDTYIDGSAVADATGHWVFQMTKPFEPLFGNRIFTATATDAAGNHSADSNAWTVDYVDHNLDSNWTSGFESFESSDFYDLTNTPVMLSSGLKIQGVGSGETRLISSEIHDYIHNTWEVLDHHGNGLSTQQGNMDTLITLPGLTQSVSFEYCVAQEVTLYDAQHNVIDTITNTNYGEVGGEWQVFSYTAPADTAIASFSVGGGYSWFDNVRWGDEASSVTGLKTAAHQSDVKESADILSLAHIDASHKATAAVDMTDHVHNTLHLTANDVLSEAHANQFIHDGKQQLVITGDQGDEVDLKVADITHNEWLNAGVFTAGGVQYEVYQHLGSDAELLIQHGLDVQHVA
ncbi:Ig-like domain-containing protein [Scandinavium goeteborgense]|uniref:VCBS repeat-containing protein n=1 Tax=Scandinavium goeteborgense TaxID=1851514 RepID=A0A4R6DPB6_SCAGO|nr:Ig-like domain-containing protein [Scandinavium goeteborgense]TDN46831.1 VCBS repeat-containing protein [Scandinavium goeteborgense]